MSIEIIIKKVSKALGDIPSSVITMGDMRGQMSSDLLKTLTDVIERKADHPRPYFILIATHIDPAYHRGVIKERVIILDEKPAKYLGSICVRVDNRLGDATSEWILPLDNPGLALVGAETANHPRQVGVVGIMESVKGLPIYHRRVA